MNPLEYALSEYGTLEDLSSGSNPRVLEYFAKVGQSWVKDDAVSWCAAFVGFCLESAGVASTKALNAQSYLKWGYDTQNVRIGDVCVFWRESKASGLGHVAFFVRKEGNYIWVLGGNQSDQVCIQKYPAVQLLAYRTYNHGHA